MTDKIVVFSTCPSVEEASALGRRLVEKRLAACVSILPAVHSIYHWKNAVDESQEVLMVIKSGRALFEQLRAELALQHSYEVPEIIALPIVDGSESYLDWLDRELAAGGLTE